MSRHLCSRSYAAAFAVGLLLYAGPALAQKPGGAPPQAPAEGFETASQVVDVAIMPLADLPPAPAGAADREGCEHLVAGAMSDAGRVVESLGWAVTGEATLGAHQAVSFVGRFEVGTSGSCLLGAGNIGFFSGNNLLAIAYAADETRLTIGSVMQRGDDGLRIWSGDFLQQPIADVRMIGDSAIAVIPLAPEETVCGGDATVPNVYGLPIGLARVLLMEAGWVGIDGSAERGEDLRASELADAGMTEISGCSGTGFGFCAYSYEGPAGTLSVSTVGEGELPAGPAVSGYGVTCAAP